MLKMAVMINKKDILLNIFTPWLIQLNMLFNSSAGEMAITEFFSWIFLGINNFSIGLLEELRVVIEYLL